MFFIFPCLISLFFLVLSTCLLPFILKMGNLKALSFHVSQNLLQAQKMVSLTADLTFTKLKKGKVSFFRYFAWKYRIMEIKSTLRFYQNHASIYATCDWSTLHSNQKRLIKKSSKMVSFFISEEFRCVGNDIHTFHHTFCKIVPRNMSNLQFCRHIKLQRILQWACQAYLQYILLLECPGCTWKF